MKHKTLTLPRFMMFTVGAWVLLSSAQTAHFYYYFEQSFANALKWSFRDWLVWFVIFWGVYYLNIRHSLLTVINLRSAIKVASIALLCIAIQVFIIVCLDFLSGSASRPFLADFAHLFSKRWLQYLFIFAVFWLLLSRYFANDSIELSSSTETNARQIKLNDGKQVHWLKVAEIFSIEAAGNYLSIQSEKGQVIVRRTIKAMEEEIKGSGFLRVSRSCMVNVTRIKSCQRVSRSKVELELTNGKIVNVGPTYWAAVREQLKI